ASDNIVLLTSASQQSFCRQYKTETPHKDYFKPTGEMGSSVHMMCYDDAAVGVYEHLKPIRGDSWIMVWDVRERQYQGWDPDISHSLYMGIEGKVRIFYVPSPISTLPIRNIITIWQCNYAVNKRILFGVISEVIKHPEITTNGVYHTMFGVVDPTCLHPGASKKDLLLHVFMNERGTKKLRGTVERGQIIRTSNMMVFSAKSVVRFSSACSEEFELITDYENYRVIDVEKAEITRLREWWASHHHELPPKAQQTDPSQQVAQPPRVQDTVRVEDSARVKDTNQPIKRTYPSPRGSSTPAKHKDERVDTSESGWPGTYEAGAMEEEQGPWRKNRGHGGGTEAMEEEQGPWRKNRGHGGGTEAMEEEQGPWRRNRGHVVLFSW
ncbi:hypothetical protein Hamer_G025252, partial [Homarus americanus]